WLGIILMMLFWILVVAAFVAFISWLVRQAKSTTHNNDNGSQAIDILKERYAKGEINKEEFKAKKKDLA
ncbi:MAG: SHOCT domain-containing protein, partial [Patescibacteria group bacterium]